MPKPRVTYKRPRFAVYHEVTVIDKVTGELKVLMISRDKKYLEGLQKHLSNFFLAVGLGDRFAILLIPA